MPFHACRGGNAWFRLPFQWGHVYSVYGFRRKAGMDINAYLPDTVTAIEKFKKLGLLTEHVNKEEKPQEYNWLTCAFRKISLKISWKIRSKFTSFLKVRRHHMLWAAGVYLLTGKDSYRPYKLDYPLAISISDLVIIPQDTLEDFAYYCGVFASTDLFVEIAVPTAMILSQELFRLTGELSYKSYPNHFGARQKLPNKEEDIDSIGNILAH